MFTAFDKVHPTQYDLYAEYSEIDPASDEVALRIAQAILDTTPEDDLAQELTVALRVEKDKKTKAQVDLFAIRSASGEEFDIYLVDENGLLFRVVTSVEGRLVRIRGEGLVMLEHFTRSRMSAWNHIVEWTMFLGMCILMSLPGVAFWVILALLIPPLLVLAIGIVLAVGYLTARRYLIHSYWSKGHKSGVPAEHANKSMS